MTAEHERLLLNKSPIALFAFRLTACGLALGSAYALVVGWLQGGESAIVLSGDSATELHAEPGKQCTARLKFRNLSGRDVTVSRVDTSCGCAVPVFDQSVTTRDGETGEVQVLISATDIPRLGSACIHFNDTNQVCNATFRVLPDPPTGCVIAPAKVRIVALQSGVELTLVLPHCSASPIDGRVTMPTVTGRVPATIGSASNWRRLGDGRFSITFTVRAEQYSGDLPAELMISVDGMDVGGSPLIVTP